MAKRPPRVVVIGGGYVAIWLARKVRSAVRRGELELTVIDRNNFHTFHGLVPEMLVGKIQAGQIISPARRLFAPGRFIAAEVGAIDVENRRISLSRILDGFPSTIEYDHLVVNVGSADDLTRYRGIGEHAMRLKSYMDCIRVRNHVLAMLEMAEIEDDPAERRRLLHFVIAGGNYAGVEVAAELSDFVFGLARREFRRIDAAEVTITIVHSTPRVLPELGRRFPGLAEYAEGVLTSRGITLARGLRLASATPGEALLSDGTRLATRTIVSCVGTAHNPLLDQLPFPRDPGGRLVTDPAGRVSAEHGIWAAGDCAAVPMRGGEPAPPLALYAMKGGETIGENLLRTVRGRPLVPYAFKGLGDACVLGGGKAVGQLWGIPLKGFLAYLIWKGCMIVYLPIWAKRVRTLLDWITVPIFGRDIASVNASDRVGVGRVLYETGQEIIRQGDVGNAMYIVQSGSLEVVEQTPAGERRLGVLVAGDHFGEIAVLKDVRRNATVRALEPVELLRIARDETRLLTATLPPLGERVRERGPGRAAES